MTLRAESRMADLLSESDGQSYIVPPRHLAQVAYTSEPTNLVAEDLLNFANGRRFGTILADPPWQFTNRTGKMAPEHKRLSRYGTMSLADIAALPVAQLVSEPAHLYLWVPQCAPPGWPDGDEGVGL